MSLTQNSHISDW